MRINIKGYEITGVPSEIAELIKKIDKTRTQPKNNNKSKGRKWKRWSEQEVTALHKLITEGHNIKHIQKTLGRNFNSVKAQAYQKFGYLLKKGKFYK